MKLNLLSTKVETNTNIHEYLIVLVVLVNTILVPNTRYIILLRNLNSSVKVIKCTSIHSINLKVDCKENASNILRVIAT